MSVVELFATGDQIATYASLSSSGNANGVQVELFDVEPLGSPTDVFRIEVRQVNAGQSTFQNGQMVDIYAWPESDPPGPPLFSNLNPQADQFQGRASSSDHQVFTSPSNIVFDVNGLEPGTVQYGPGREPPRDEQLSFDAFPSEPPFVPCFAAGTLIEAEDGARPIETLRPGDRVRTLDRGLQPVRWVGNREVSGRGSMAPIEIKAGALGNLRNLRVSPQHRMLIGDWRTELYFGKAQVLVPAVHLVNGTTIRQVPCHTVRYVHLAFDHHEVIWAEGAPSESLHLGGMALQSMSRAARDEIEALFPELIHGDAAGVLQLHATARQSLRRWESTLIAC